MSEEFKELTVAYQQATKRIATLETNHQEDVERISMLEKRNDELEKRNGMLEMKVDTLEKSCQEDVQKIGIKIVQLENKNNDWSRLCDIRYDFVNNVACRVQKVEDDLKEVLAQQMDVNMAVTPSAFGNELVPYEKPSTDSVKQVEEKVLELERTLNVISVHHSELELQLQASLASTHNGAFLWRIPEVRRRIRDAKIGRITSIYSPPFYTGRNGYKMCIRAYLNGDGSGEGTHLSIFFVLMKGEYDPLLKWPFEHKVSLILVDQDHKKNLIHTFKPDPHSSSFQRPKLDMNVASGFPKFAKISIFDNPSYVKDNVMYIKAIIDTSRIVHP